MGAIEPPWPVYAELDRYVEVSEVGRLPRAAPPGTSYPAMDPRDDSTWLDGIWASAST